MKLQKLLYYAHGWHLGVTGTPLLDETIEAWKYGPVVRSVYGEFAEFGNGWIDREATDFRLKPNGRPEMYVPTVPEDDGKTRRFLDQVWDVYKKYTGVRLSNATHVPDGPWDVVVREYGGDPPKGLDIPDDLIAEWFKQRVKADKAQPAAHG